jgi:peptide chain release factor 2
LNKSGTGFDLASKISLRGELEKKMARPGFWDDPEKAKDVVWQLSAVKSIIEPVQGVISAGRDLSELFELATQENDAGRYEGVFLQYSRRGRGD